MKTLQAMAEQACRDLAMEIFSLDCPTLTPLLFSQADKIEHRFKLYGMTDALVKSHNLKRLEFIEEQREQIYASYPELKPRLDSLGIPY